MSMARWRMTCPSCCGRPRTQLARRGGRAALELSSWWWTGMQALTQRDVAAWGAVDRAC
jgi:hypothetical protein